MLFVLWWGFQELVCLPKDLEVLKRTLELLLQRFAHVFFVLVAEWHMRGLWPLLCTGQALRPGNHDVYVGTMPRTFTLGGDSKCPGAVPRQQQGLYRVFAGEARQARAFRRAGCCSLSDKQLLNSAMC